MKQFLFSRRVLALVVATAAFATVPVQAAFAATAAGSAVTASGNHAQPDPMWF